MAIQIRFDSEGNALRPTLVLANRRGDKLGALATVGSFELTDSFSSASEFQAIVYKELDGVECALWRQIVDLKLVWCKEWDKWFEIKVDLNESTETTKSIVGTSLAEAELAQVVLYGVEVNTEGDISREDYIKPTVLYSEEDSSISLLDRIMEKAPHYRIKHVDYQLAGIQRMFSFDGTSIYDAMQQIAEEIECLFVFDSSSAADGSIDRTVSVYDLLSYCTACGHRDTFDGVCPECGSDAVTYGYGEDTTVFVSRDNLTDEVSLSTDIGSVKNCFRMQAGDELMTATIANCNANGSSYIWYISDDTKADMPDELVSRLAEYDELYEYYQTQHETVVSSANKYNALVDKYLVYDDELAHISETIVGYPGLMEASYEVIDLYYYLQSRLMPGVELMDTTAAEQGALLTADNLSPVSVTDVSVIQLATANSAVLAMAKCVVDARYQVKVGTSSLTSQTWSGTFVVTSYADEEDTYTTGEVQVLLDDDYEGYVRQMLSKTLSKATVDDYGIGGIFSQDYDVFCNTLTMYCLDQLGIFNDACQSCLDILIDQGVADKDAYEDETADLYNSLYLPYYNKKKAIEAEMSLRSSEVATVQEVADELDEARWAVQDVLDMETFLGEDLWLLLCAYRREDTFSNDNYISDGLTNAEIFEYALQFIEDAKAELYKQAELQHSITSTLKNLLVIPEFAKLRDSFAVGNWIRVRVDDEIYRLRLLSYGIRFDSLEGLDVTFSDVVKESHGVTDAAQVLAAAQTMATSYGAVTRQAERGATSMTQLNNWVENGLALTNMQIVSNADNQSLTIDSHGLLAREYLPITDTYSPEQLKVINKGLYVTDDDWLTSRAGIGKFKYYDPETGKMVDAYGVIADTLVGNLVLSEKVGVYTESGNIKLDQNGIAIETESAVEDAVPVFLIRRKNEDGTYSDIMYVDSSGYLQLNGSIKISSGSSSSQLGGLTASIETRYLQNDSDTIAPKETWYNWSTTVPTRVSGKYIWMMQRTTYANGSYRDSEPVCITGATGGDGSAGLNGVGVSEIINYYLATSDSSGVTINTAGWTSTIQEMSETKNYLWNYEVVTYTDGATAKTTPCVIGRYAIDGEAGRGITSIVEYYAVSAQSTEAPSDWSTVVPTMTDTLRYLWNYESVVYSDNTSEDSEKRVIGVYGDRGSAGKQAYDVAVDNGFDGDVDEWLASLEGADGDSGTSIFRTTSELNVEGETSVELSAIESLGHPILVGCLLMDDSGDVGYITTVGTDSVTCEYRFTMVGVDGAAGEDGSPAYLHVAYANSQDGTSGFSISSADGKVYMGTYTDSTEADSTDPADYTWVKIKGDDGVGVKSSSVTYQASTSGTSTPAGTWLTSVPTVAEGSYLWTRTVITYTDSTTSTSYSVSRSGVSGAVGNGIQKITNYYLASAASTGVTTSTSGWTVDVQSISSSKRYLWNYEVVEYTSGTSETTDPVVIGTYGIDGNDGSDGRGIQTIVEYYLVQSASSGVSTSTSGWQTTAPTTTTTNKYLWNYEVVTYTDGQSITIAPCIIGTHGADGTSVMVQSTQVKYGTSTSASMQPSSWSATIPSVAAGAYLWTQTTVTYTDGNSTVTYTYSRQGANGSAGANGTSSYLHIKYSDDGVSFTGNNGEDLGAWVGTLVDNNESDSAVFSDYTWKKFTGDVYVGARNLLYGSSTAHSATNPVATYYLTEALVAGEQYTVTVWGDPGTSRTGFTAFYDDTSTTLASALSETSAGVYSATFVAPDITVDGDTPGSVVIYGYPRTVSATSTITKAKLEKGNIATDWSLAPEESAMTVDVSVAIQGVQDSYDSLSDSMSSAMQDIRDNYATSDDLSGVSGSLQSGIDDAMSAASAAQNAADQANSNYNNLTKFMSFDGQTGLTIGAEGSSFKTVIDESSMNFMEGTSVVAKITNQELQISKATIVHATVQGTLTLGQFKFISRDDGSMSLVWVTE